MQAQAFYEASPIAPLDSLLYYIFQVLTSAAEFERSCIALALVQSALDYTAKSHVSPALSACLLCKDLLQSSAPEILVG